MLERSGMGVIAFPPCPYCGEQMRLEADSVHAWCKCDSCLAASPKVYRPDFKNSEFPFDDWSDFWDECKKLVVAAAELEAKQPRWISVEERPPEFPCMCWDGENPVYIPKCIGTVQLKSGKRVYVGNLDRYAHLWCIAGSEKRPDYVTHITHWMPMPKPPAEGGCV